MKCSISQSVVASSCMSSTTNTSIDPLNRYDVTIITMMEIYLALTPPMTGIKLTKLSCLYFDNLLIIISVIFGIGFIENTAIVSDCMIPGIRLGSRSIIFSILILVRCYRTGPLTSIFCFVCLLTCLFLFSFVSVIILMASYVAVCLNLLNLFDNGDVDGSGSIPMVRLWKCKSLV